MPKAPNSVPYPHYFDGYGHGVLRTQGVQRLPRLVFLLTCFLPDVFTFLFFLVLVSLLHLDDPFPILEAS